MQLCTSEEHRMTDVPLRDPTPASCRYLIFPLLMFTHRITSYGAYYVKDFSPASGNQDVTKTTTTKSFFWMMALGPKLR